MLDTAGVTPSQALSALDCEMLDKPIGEVDLELTTIMTDEGLQVTVRDTATGQINRTSTTWADMVE